MNKISERPTVSRNDRDNTTEQTAPGITERRPVEIIKRALKEYPSQVVQLASVPFITAIMAASGGFGLLRQIADAVMSGNLLGVVTLYIAATYALQATNATRQMKEGMRAADHDNQSANVIISLYDLVKDLRDEVKDLKNAQTQRDSHVESVNDRLDNLIGELFRIYKGDRRVQKNSVKLWWNFATGSTVFNVNGQCRFDVNSERRADGTIVLTPDYERLVSWAWRYGPEGVAWAHIILFVDGNADDNAAVAPAPIAYHLTAFRAVKKLAHAYGAKLHLDRVRFYLQPTGDARRIKTFITGEYSFGGNSTVPFVNSYCDHAAMYNVPRSLLDDDVETCNSPEEVSKYRHVAEALIAELPSHTLEDLERRYGHLVPHVDFDRDFVKRNPGILPSANQSGDIIENGDHFVIPR